MREERRRPASHDAVAAAVAAAEQLVAAADGEQRGAAVDRLAQRRAVAGEVGRDHRLLAVLAAADVEEVVRSRARAASPIEIGVDASSWPRAAARRSKHGDVAAVGVDVEVLGIEVADADDHDAPLSQYGRVEAAVGRDRAQPEHRGVGREDDELAARRRQREPAVERRLERRARPRAARAGGRRR